MNKYSVNKTNFKTNKAYIPYGWYIPENKICYKNEVYKYRNIVISREFEDLHLFLPCQKNSYWNLYRFDNTLVFKCYCRLSYTIKDIDIKSVSRYSLFIGLCYLFKHKFIYIFWSFYEPFT